MRERWSAEQAWDWYGARPWVMGINYVPAMCLHSIELWQADTIDEVMPEIRKELALMDDIGINGVRMFLPFDKWYFEREAFLDRVDRVLGEMAAHGITMMPVLYNDCVNFGRPDNIEPEQTKGWQKYDIGHHGGHKDNPFTGEKERVGWIRWDEPDWHPVLEEYIRAIVGRFRDDPRIYGWDMWNEPGNSNRGDMSIPYLRRAFAVAREMDPTQPLTAGPWLYPEGYGVTPGVDLQGIQRVALDESDIVTFHQYDPFDKVLATVGMMEKEGRPMMNTEWLNRIQDNLLEENLRLYHDKRIGSYSWGLVAGKSQHFLPWDNLWNHRELPLNRWQHDLFDTYHTPYDEHELEVMRELSPKK